MTRIGDFDTVTVLNSRVLTRADGRAAILLEGERRPNEPYSVAFEVTLETLAILRKEVAKAEKFLSAPTGTA